MKTSEIAALSSSVPSVRQKRPEVSESQPQSVVAFLSDGLSEEELSRPGGRLLALLLRRAAELGHTRQEMASALGVTYGYISQLRSGTRQTKHIADKFAAACALYLGTSRLAVLLLSGRVQCFDIFDNAKMAAQEVPRALKYISTDPEYGHLLPPQAHSAPEDLQLLIVLLYEKATKRKLLPPQIEPERFATLLADLDSVRHKLKTEASADDDGTQQPAEASDAEFAGNLVKTEVAEGLAA